MGRDGCGFRMFAQVLLVEFARAQNTRSAVSQCVELHYADFPGVDGPLFRAMKDMRDEQLFADSGSSPVGSFQRSPVRLLRVRPSAQDGPTKARYARLVRTTAHRLASALRTPDHARPPTSAA